MAHTGVVNTTPANATPQPACPADACCLAPAVAIDDETPGPLADALKALADPTRLRLVRLIAARPGATACICELTDPIGVTQPTVSHHMKQLVDAGLATRQQKGKWAHYTLNQQAFTELSEEIEAMTK